MIEMRWVVAKSAGVPPVGSVDVMTKIDDRRAEPRNEREIFNPWTYLSHKLQFRYQIPKIVSGDKRNYYNVPSSEWSEWQDVLPPYAQTKELE